MKFNVKCVRRLVITYHNWKTCRRIVQPDHEAKYSKSNYEQIRLDITILKFLIIINVANEINAENYKTLILQRSPVAQFFTTTGCTKEGIVFRQRQSVNPIILDLFWGYFEVSFAHKFQFSKIFDKQSIFY